MRITNKPEITLTLAYLLDFDSVITDGAQLGLVYIAGEVHTDIKINQGHALIFLSFPQCWGPNKYPPAFSGTYSLLLCGFYYNHSLAVSILNYDHSLAVF